MLDYRQKEVDAVTEKLAKLSEAYASEKQINESLREQIKKR